MSDDLLERATAALRETSAEPTSELERARARARLLSGARRRAGLRPQTLWQWAAVILAGFFVSTAMAHVIRVQAPRILEALRSQATEPSATKPKPARRAQPNHAKPAPAPEPTAPAAEPAAPQVPEVAAPAPSAPAAARDAGASLAPPKLRSQSRPIPKPSSANLVRSPQPQAESPESPELALFRQAQALHLARDPRAIEAWDAYLRAAERGPLVPEAQYNRALGLVRAGRYAEAKSALSPFAEGVFGAYRQREAQALLERLAH